MDHSYRTLNPATGELVQSYPLTTPEQAQRILQTAMDAYLHWRKTSMAHRRELMLRAADILESRAKQYARLMAVEMGKPLAEGIGEAKKCAWVCRYYAEEAANLLAPQPLSSDASETYLRHDPIGPILAIMPWNFPFWQVFRFAAPNLMAGNVALLKHAPNTPGCAEAIQTMMLEAGFPEGVFQNMRLSNPQTSALIEDQRVAGVTLTGSTLAGRAVAQTSGSALKPMVMELGGSDPFIVFDDADISKALSSGVSSRCLNAGQSCIAAKRFLVHTDIQEQFTRELSSQMQALQVGDPLQEGTSIGPLAREDLRDQLHQQVQRSIQAGATALCGAEIPSRDGFFYPPTVLSDVSLENPAAHEEIFGPVAVVMPFSDEEEALSLANATPYGLGASLWTSDSSRALRLIPQIDAGNVFVNGMVKSDPRIPFGGTKLSGFGRELGREGILAFTNAKTVWIA